MFARTNTMNYTYLGCVCMYINKYTGICVLISVARIRSFESVPVPLNPVVLHLQPSGRPRSSLNFHFAAAFHLTPT